MNDESREEAAERSSGETGQENLIARPITSAPEIPSLRAPVPLTGKRALGEIIFVLIFLLVPSLIRNWIAGTSTIEQAKEYGLYLYLIVFIQGALVILAVALVLFWDRQPWRTVGLHFKNLAGEIPSAAIALAVIYTLQMAFAFVIANYFPDQMKGIEKQRVEVLQMFPKISPVFLVIFTLFVGLYEELLFRGFLLTRLVKVTRSLGFALVLSSVLFALAHASYQDPLAVMQIFIVAMVLGGLFIIRRSLISPILVHAMFDFVSLMMAFYFLSK